MQIIKNIRKYLSPGPHIHQKSPLGYWTKVGRGTTIGSHVRLGDWTTIGMDCAIGNFCALGPHAKIGDNVQLGANVTLGSHTRIQSGLIIPDNTRFADNDLVTRQGVIANRCGGYFGVDHGDFNLISSSFGTFLVPVDVASDDDLYEDIIDQYQWGGCEWLDQFKLHGFPKTPEELAQSRADIEHRQIISSGARLRDEIEARRAANATMPEQDPDCPEL